jgi:carboxylesterase
VIQPKFIHNHHLDGDSFLWEGGRIGVLLSHGYTATTAEVRPLARLLHTRGFTVAGPLLPGHGTAPRELNRCRWQDWVAALERTYQRLSRRCTHIFVGGESMGGVLALTLATQHPETSGILVYSPAVKIPRRPLLMAYLARPFVRYVKKKGIQHLHPDWQGYPVNPVAAVVRLHQMQRQLWPQIPQLGHPLLIVQGRHDTDIDLNGIEQLYNVYTGPIKELHWMEHSGHVVMLDTERAQVAEITAKFIYRVIGGTQ